jgi:hypothetical protein
MRPQIALFLALTFAPAARAATVTIQFSGYLTDVNHGGPLPSDALIIHDGYPPLSVVVGDLFSGTYSYDDTVQALAPFSTYYHQVFYFNRDHPISMSILIDGDTYSPDGDLDQLYVPPNACGACSFIELTNTSVVVDGQPLNWYDLRVADSNGRQAFLGLTRDPDLSSTGILGDAPIPSLPAVGGRLTLALNPTVLISEAQTVDGQITGPGTIPIFLPDPDNPRMRTWQKTQLPAVYQEGDYVQGQITSFSVVPEPSILALLVVGLGALALSSRSTPCETLGSG